MFIYSLRLRMILLNQYENIDSNQLSRGNHLFQFPELRSDVSKKSDIALTDIGDTNESGKVLAIHGALKRDVSIFSIPQLTMPWLP